LTLSETCVYPNSQQNIGKMIICHQFETNL
jgi:hypothetical protein